MRRSFQRLASVVVLALSARVHASARAQSTSRTQPALGADSTETIERDGLRCKDLNRNGTLEPYEDWRLTPTARASDLVGRMTLEEKAGTMMHGTARSVGPLGMAGVGTTYDTAANRRLVD